MNAAKNYNSLCLVSLDKNDHAKYLCDQQMHKYKLSSFLRENGDQIAYLIEQTSCFPKLETKECNYLIKACHKIESNQPQLLQGTT